MERFGGVWRDGVGVGGGRGKRKSEEGRGKEMCLYWEVGGERMDGWMGKLWIKRSFEVILGMCVSMGRVSLICLA